MKRFAPLLATLLAACAVGPNYERPAPSAPATGGFVDPGVAKVTPGPASTDWWRLFQDPVLDRLVQRALANNTDIRVAEANLRRARAVLSRSRADRLPTTTISGNATRQRSVQPQFGAFETDLHQVGFDAQYELDLFGRVTRSIEASKGDRDAAAAQLDAARVSVAAETARAYAQACGFAAQADVARETERLQSETRSLTQRLLDAGRGTRRELDQAITLAENARAQVPQFEAERRASLYALTTLTGRTPAEVDADAAACKTPPAVVSLIPVGDGAALLARRPDVRAAERALAADTARIGIATAALYPSIKLGGSLTSTAVDIEKIGSPGSIGFSLGPLLSWTFPNIAVARAQIKQARAQADASLAAFDGAILTALREVEQALARYSGELDRNAALRRAANAAESAARIAGLRFNAGRDSFLQRLDAERERATARAQLASSNAALAEAQVSLFKALGGGWENAPSVAERPRAGTAPAR